MTVHEEQHREESNILDRERTAFQRFKTALFAVRRQFYPLGNGIPTDESSSEFEAAKCEWDAARAEVDRIAEEIRTGKRR